MANFSPVACPTNRKSKVGLRQTKMEYDGVHWVSYEASGCQGVLGHEDIHPQVQGP
jgi:hypothetical protein